MLSVRHKAKNLSHSTEDEAVILLAAPFSPRVVPSHPITTQVANELVGGSTPALLAAVPVTAEGIGDPRRQEIREGEVLAARLAPVRPHVVKELHKGAEVRCVGYAHRFADG